jgi:Mrr N-terminal domain
MESSKNNMRSLGDSEMIPQNQLDQEARELDAKIRKTEENIRSLQAELAVLQKDRAAVSHLAQRNQRGAAGDANGNPQSPLPASHWPTSSQARHRTIGNGTREQTLYTEFDRPLLESLVALGGRGSAEDVLQHMKAKMEPTLKPRDFEVVSSGEERWRNTARWRRNALVKLGFLRPGSQRGIWEISDSGKAWLEQRP